MDRSVAADLKNEYNMGLYVCRNYINFRSGSQDGNQVGVYKTEPINDGTSLKRNPYIFFFPSAP
jgi:hypothetical protein